jgi:hypothetical protein
VGSEPGSSQFHLFSHFHHFTAEPQRLPTSKYFILTNIVTFLTQIHVSGPGLQSILRHPDNPEHLRQPGANFVRLLLWLEKIHFNFG